MKVHRLGSLLEVKYGLKSLAASQQEMLGQVKRDLINAYNLYVDSKKAKEPVLQMLADIKEPFSRGLVRSMEELLANLDSLGIESIFKRVNGILAAIHEMKNDPDKTVRNFIHDSIRATKESERNYREHVKSKFEMIVSRLSSILEKQAKVLQALIRIEHPESKGPELEGGAVEPQRKEISKDKILMFMRSPAAQKYGLDSLEVMSRVLSYPDLKSKITTIINAVDRGHTPLDGPAVRDEVAEIMKIYQERQSTNIPALEQSPEKPAPTVSLLGGQE